MDGLPTVPASWFLLILIGCLARPQAFKLTGSLSIEGLSQRLGLI